MPKSFNLSRVRFTAFFICALCKVQSVGFEKPALAFDSPAKCTLRSFVADYSRYLDVVARFIFALLPLNRDLPTAWTRPVRKASTQ